MSQCTNNTITNRLNKDSRSENKTKKKLARVSERVK